MELAITKAKEGLLDEEIPVGALIVNKNNHILALTNNQCLNFNDPTAHAEILAIREACKQINNYRLEGCILYCTIEPCSMCLGAIQHARIDSLYFGAYNYKFGGINKYNISSFSSVGARPSSPNLHIEDLNKQFLNYPINHQLKIYSGFYEEECKTLLQDFFKTKALKLNRSR